MVIVGVETASKPDINKDGEAVGLLLLQHG